VKVLNSPAGRVCQLALVIASIGAVTAIYGYRKYGKLLADMSEARVLELSDAYHLLKEQKLKHHYSPSIYCRLRGRVALPPKVTPLVAEVLLLFDCFVVGSSLQSSHFLLKLGDIVEASSDGKVPLESP
jgi:hypothetical protein